MRFQPGVLTGDQVTELLNDAKDRGYAIPAVNVIGTNSINAVLETAREVNSPVIIQFSNGGGAFYAGKGLSNGDQQAAIAGSVSGAHHIHQMAALYQVPVIVHTDHCAKNLLPWMDGMLQHGESLSVQENHYSPLTCWIFLRNHWKKILSCLFNILTE